MIRSINLEAETNCVDIFRRPEASFGFDAFRRDPEDGRGWYSIGHHGAGRFARYETAFAEALSEVR